jgi:hypothetical protein
LKEKKIGYIWQRMGFLAEHIGKENTFIGSKVEVGSARFSFQMASDKAMTADQITAMGLKDVPNGGKVWSVKMCNTKLDRHNEAFTKPVLDVYAKQINAEGVTYNLFHDRAIPIGKVLKSATVTMELDGSSTLEGFVWINDKAVVPSQPDITVSEAIETGMLKDVSVEVSGTVRYVENPTGGQAVWEYYIDTERPQATEISGLALVQKGAQIGASLVTKSIGEPPKRVSKTENMQFDKEYEAGGKSHRIYTEKAADGTITLNGVIEAIEAHKAAEIAKADATTAKATAEAEVVTLKFQLAEARKSHEADLVNYSGLNKDTVPTADAIKAMDFVTLKTAADAAKAKHDSTASKEVTTTTEAAPWEFNAK